MQHFGIDEVLLVVVVVDQVLQPNLIATDDLTFGLHDQPVVPSGPPAGLQWPVLLLVVIVARIISGATAASTAAARHIVRLPLASPLG